MSGGVRPLLATALALSLSGCAGRAAERPATAPAQPSATRLLVAYNVLHDEEADDYEVFVMDLDGGGKTNVTNDAGVDWVYHAYRDRMFLVSDRDDERRKYHLYEMDARGRDLRKITGFRVHDSWLGSRREGRELIVASSKDAKKDLYLIDRRGNVLRRLTDDEHYDNDPYFSPDGERIVFRSKRSGVDELWLMNADGTGLRQLTRFPDDEAEIEPHAYHAGPPIWEPNRDVISFGSKRGGRYAIYTIRPDGSDLRRVGFDDVEALWHSWSPDGRLLAFDGKNGEGNYDIYVLDTETGEVRRLTDDPRYEGAPVFVEAPAR